MYSIEIMQDIPVSKLNGKRLHDRELTPGKGRNYYTCHREYTRCGIYRTSYPRKKHSFLESK
jgi:hypothetical protein